MKKGSQKSDIQTAVEHQFGEFINQRERLYNVLADFRQDLTELAISTIKQLDDHTSPRVIQVAEAIHDLPALVRVLQDQVFLIEHAINSLSKSSSNETQKQS